MEVTRTIQIQVTKVYQKEWYWQNLPNDALLLPEMCEKRIRERIEEELNGADQVLVEVKDFIGD